MNYTNLFEELSKASVAQAGGKGASLGEMTQAGIPVPPGFVILSAAFERFLEETDLNVEIDAILDTVDHAAVHTVDKASEDIRYLILDAKMPRDIEIEITKGFSELDTEFVAVRSSATSEDSAAAAWAGQLDSFLNTTEKTLLENVKKCWASLFTPRAIFYRFEKSLHGTDISVAVVVQKMIQSEVSGIAFSVHPVTQDYDQLIIEAGFGLGEAIVSGSITPDSFVVEKSNWNILDTNISVQDRGLFKKDDGGNEWKDIPKEKGETPSLTSEQVLELSKLIVRIEDHYGFPCDIEWARESGDFYIVQSRPITTLAPKETETSDILKDFLSGFENDIFYPLVPVTIISSGAGGFSPNFGGRIKNFLIKFLIAMQDGKGSVLMSETRYTTISEDFFSRYTQTPALLKTAKQELEALEKQVNDLYLSLTYEEVAKLSEEESIQKLQSIIELVREYNCTAWFSTIFDKDVCLKFIQDNNLNISPATVEEVWEKAIVPTTDSFDKKKFKEVLLLVSKGESLRNIAEKMQYAYAGYTEIKSIQGSEEELQKEFSQYLNNPSKAQTDLEKENSFLGERVKSFVAWFETLNIEQKQLVSYVQGIIDLRDSRKAMIGKGLVANLRIGEKLLAIAGLDKGLLYYCAYEEFLNGSRYFEEKKSEITKRPSGVLFLQQYDGSIDFQYSDFDRIREKMESLYLRSQQTDNEQIKGQIAFPGKVRGKVSIILRPQDFHKFQEGSVLVTSMTRPEFVPLMKKAIAVITDEGGITSHAAIVSRELKTPCIIGTKIATKRLKDGDEIEVDADNGLVRLLNIN